MNRRTFLEGLAALLATGVFAELPPRARAASPPSYPLYVNALASGGWDVSITFDPKSGPLYPINRFAAADYQRVGAFTLAPGSTAALQFFRRYAAKILLINGVFAETVDHDVGRRLAVSGSTTLGFPCFAGLFAAHVAPAAALAFVTGGDANETASEVAKTLVSPSLAQVMASTQSPTGSLDAVDGVAIQRALAARLARQQGRPLLPLRQQKLAELARARAGYASFPGVLATLADLQANVPLVAGVAGAAGAAVDMANNPAFLEAQIALAGYVNGATASANVQFGNFDQHTLFYPDHVQQYDGFFVAMDYLWRAAAHLGVADRLHVTMGSDFTRTPYNDSDAGNPGKAHWAETTSVLVMGPGITGNRVIGATTDGKRSDYTDTLTALPVDAKTLAPASSGVLIQRAHIHYELRRVAGLLGTPLDQKYPLQLPSAPLRLFA